MTNKSWTVTLGSFGMLFVTIIGDSLGLDVSPEGIAAAQNIAMTSAGAGAAVSVIKKVPEIKEKVRQQVQQVQQIQQIPQAQQSKTPKVGQSGNAKPYAKNTAWSMTTGQDELQYGAGLWVRATQKSDVMTARVEKIVDNRLVGMGQTTGGTDVRISMVMDGMPAPRGAYKLAVTFQKGASIQRYTDDVFAVV